MTAFPLRYAHQNILFGHGDLRGALYRVDTTSYPFLPHQDKIDLLQRIASFAFAAGADFTIYRVNRNYPVERYAEDATAMLDPRTGYSDQWRAYLLGHYEHLRRMRPWSPEVYISVRLSAQRQADIGSSIVGMADYLKRSFAHARPGKLRVSAAELEALTAAEARVLDTAELHLPIRRVTTRELQWLLRRIGCRGVCEPTLDRYWEPAALVVEEADLEARKRLRVRDAGGLRQLDAIKRRWARDPRPAIELHGELEREVVRALAYEPLETDVWRQANYPVYEEDRTLVVDAEEGRTYQAMLALGALPDSAEFPGSAELIFSPLDGFNEPVDVTIDCRWIANREAVTKVQRRIVDADLAYEERMEAGHHVGHHHGENRQLARELDAYLQSHEHPPLLMGSIKFAVSKAKRDDLESVVHGLEQRYGGGLRLHRPLGLQAALFFDHIPRPDAGAVRDYEDVMTVEQLGALVPTGTHECGSERGALWGHTASGGRRPVLQDVTEAPRAKRTATVVMAGTLGAGKTFAAELLALQAVLIGSRVVVVDPKGDWELGNLPEMEGKVGTLELDGTRDAYHGLLDPLVTAPPDMREDQTHSYLMELLPRNVPATWDTHVLRRVQDVAKQEGKGCRHVVETLLTDDDPDARAVGEALRVRFRSGLARLAYGPSTSGLHLDDHRVTLIRPGGLQLPDADVMAADYSTIERVSVATLQLVASFALRLVRGDRSAHKVLFLDDAQFLLASRSGRALVDRISTMSRALNVTLYIMAQRLLRVGDVENLAGVRMMFGQESEHDARVALELIGLDPNDQRLVDRIMSFRDGRCFLRDLRRRVGEVQVDVVYPHFLELLETSPDETARAG